LTGPFEELTMRLSAFLPGFIADTKAGDQAVCPPDPG